MKSPDPRKRIADLKRNLRWLSKKNRKRKGDEGGAAEPEPAEPPRPKPLAGGAAAELEADD